MSHHLSSARRLRGCLLACIVAGCGTNDLTSDPVDSDNAVGAQPGDPVKAAAVIAKAQGLVRPGSIVQTEARFGVPTFLWASRTAGVAAASQSFGAGAVRPEVAAARALVTTYAPLYGLSASDVDDAVVAKVDNRRGGPVLVKLRGQRDGVEIFGEELNILMNGKLEGIALSGFVSSQDTPAAKPGGLAFGMTAAEAAAGALGKQAGAAIGTAMLVAGGARGGYDTFTVTSAAGVELEDAIRVKPVYFHLPAGLEAAYYVEVIAKTGAAPAHVLAVDGQPIATSEGFAYVISALTGQVLFRKDLTAHAQPYTYRVWADPVTGIPHDSPAGNAAHPHPGGTPDGAQAAFIPQSDVTLQNFPFSHNDPWLPDNATETVGNNVDAFLNLFEPDGLGTPVALPSDPPTGDFRAQITAANQFLHTNDPTSNGALAESRQGAIVQLFYSINFLHDWYYDAGFDEAAGNAQLDNFGRGGLGNDSINGQVQDFAGYSNANMLTPADGQRPRMRMYNFPSPANHLKVTGPAAPAGKYAIGVSMSGTQVFDVSSDIVRATFSNNPTACTLTNAAEVAGKIALFDFDNTDGVNCAFSTRIARLSAANAGAILMAYKSASPTAVANITGFSPIHTKPIATVSWNTRQRIQTELTAGTTVTARLYRAPDRDGALDTQVVFHEWMHYASNRLVGDGSGLGTNHASGLGEGWGDFNGLLLQAREDDRTMPGNESYQGAYAMGTFATSGEPYDGSPNQGYYFAIRRYPYSTDMTKNPLTFRHIVKGVALPVGPPVAFGANGASNEEVHNTGEVWATMLWECYAALLRDTLGASARLSFQEAQNRMKHYLINALKITPMYPTLLEARDALLAVAYANDVADYVTFRIAFAKRGAGRLAVAPDRFSTTNAGVVEDFEVGPDVELASATLDDSPASGSCDSDGVLDAGEYGRISVTLRNVGTTTLSATKVTLSSATAALWFPDGATVSVPAMQPNATATVRVRVAYLGTVTGIQIVPVTIEYTDPSLTGGPRSDTVSFRTNTDEIPASSATDDVEAASTAWTTAFAPALGNVAPWRRVEPTAADHRWHVDDPAAASDQYLISPVLTVDGSGSFNVQFDHSFAFEFDGGGNYDGGVVEVSVNGGAWTDIGGPAYNGTIANYTGTKNPLGGRPGFVRSSGGTVHVSLTLAIAPGNTVQLRFRAGSDEAVGAVGWNIDNIAFTGVVETPFATVVAETGSCSKAPTSADLGISVTDGVTSVTAGGSVTYTIVASNAGPDEVPARVTDAFPAALECTWTCVGSAGGICTSSGAGNIADAVTLPAGGSVIYTASCSVSPAVLAGTLTNTATIAVQNTLIDANPANNTDTDVDTLVRLPAELIGEKTVTGTFVHGGTVTYTITLTNVGDGIQLDNVGNELTDVLPPGLSLVNAWGTSGITYTDVPANFVSWNGVLFPGNSVTITIVAVINAPAGTTISNQATFHYDSHGTNTNDATGVTDAYQCSMPI